MRGKRPRLLIVAGASMFYLRGTVTRAWPLAFPLRRAAVAALVNIEHGPSVLTVR